MNKYSVITLISFILAVIGLVFLSLIYLGKLDSYFALWTSLGLVVVAAALSIYRWAKTRKNKKRK